LKKLLVKDSKFLNRHLALLTARMAIAALMLTHGIPKLQLLLSGQPVQFPAVFGLSPEISLGLAVFAEVFCSLLILLGLATRFATVPLIATMLVAIFSIHAADAFSTKEPAILYLVGYVVLLFAGSGRYSLDHLLFAGKNPAGSLALKEKPSALNYL
jgi:putative oxidoreductase